MFATAMQRMHEMLAEKQPFITSALAQKFEINKAIHERLTVKY